MFIAGMLVFLAWLLFSLLWTQSFDPWFLQFYVDPANILMLLAVIGGVIVITGGAKTFVKAVNALFSKKYFISAADKERAVRLFKLMAKSVFLGSLTLTMIGLLNMLNSLSDPSALGPQAAHSFLSIFYGAVIDLLFIYPAVHVLETCYNTEEKTVISEKQVIDKLLELCYRQGISPEDILEANEIELKNIVKRQ